MSAGAVLVVASGALPPGEAAAVLARVGPILVFLAAVTVLAELADAAGVFAAAASAAARAGRGSTPGLFLLVAALATATTIVLSLDTTAVLLTPVVLILAGRLDLPPVPFAVLTVWLANTASLLLPVSNLTNLLAADRLTAGGRPFALVMVAPAAAVLAVTVLVIGGRYASQLRGRYLTPKPVPVPDRPLFRIALAICAVCALLFAASEPLGIDVAVTATSGAATLLAAFVVRARSRLHSGLVPWRLLVGTTGLFLLVQTALHHGLNQVLSEIAGTGTGIANLLQLTGTAAAAANLVNNLPAYLALEPEAEASPVRLAALLIGTNAGPLILPWGSLATLLWADRCRARGVHIPARDMVVLGMLGVPVVLTTGVLALTAAS